MEAIKCTLSATASVITKVGTLTMKDVEDIAKIKLPDLNAVGLDEAKKIVMGTARSMGVDVSGS